MIHSSMRLGLVAIVALGGAAVASANGIPGANTTAGYPFACGITKSVDHGMLAIEGVVQSPTALNGEYRFALKSSGGGGSTNISQGGPFMANAGAAVSVGRVMVNANASVAVDFTVTAGGKSFDCAQELTTRT